MKETLAEITSCMPKDRAVATASTIAPNASEALREQLAAMYQNETPDPAALQALGRELDLVLRPSTRRPPHSTFLSEAASQKNYAWTIALLEAGADPNASGSLMAYTVVNSVFNKSSQVVQRFADGTPAIPFLTAYIAHGGVVNTKEDGGYGANPLVRTATRNLAALVFLLEQGADPWLATSMDRYGFNSALAGSLIWGARAPDYSETLYILARRGLITPPPNQEFQAEVDKTMLGHFEYYENASGPKMRHELWQLQKVTQALLEAGVVTTDKSLSAELSEIVPDTEGGWYLKEGELFQAPDDPRHGDVRGTEAW